MKMFLTTLTLALGLAACSAPDTVPVKTATPDTLAMSDTTKLPDTPAEWKAQLDDNQYYILR